jgi:hypothetical protein
VRAWATFGDYAAVVKFWLLAAPGAWPARPIGPGLAAYAIYPVGSSAPSTLWTRMLSGTSQPWHRIFELPNAASGPTSVSWTRMHTDVFYTTTGGTLGHTFTNDFGQTYQQPDDWGQPPGYKLISRPDATSWAEGRIDVVCIARPTGGGAATMAHATYDVTYDSQGPVWDTWGWPTQGDFVTAQSNPAITSWTVDRLDVFFIGSDNLLWHDDLDLKQKSMPDGWMNYGNMGFTLGTTIDGVSRYDSTIDLFTTDPTGLLLHFIFAETRWEVWPLGAPWQVGPPPDGGAMVDRPVSTAKTGTDGFAILGNASSHPPALWLQQYRSAVAAPWTMMDAPPSLPPLPPGEFVEVTAW